MKTQPKKPATPKTEPQPNVNDPTFLGRNFKKRLRKGDRLVGGNLLEYARPSLVKLYRQAGFDFIYVEYEHVFFSPSALADTVLSARDNGLPVIAKTPQLDRAEVAKLLECGVVGIQLPRTESRRDLETLIQYMKFPPIGTRAGAPCFGNVDYAWPANDAEWIKMADESTLVIAHIETAAGYKNAQQIISTPHVDMVYVGPYDFSISMGHPGDYDHPAVRGPMEEILKICKKHKVPFGTTASFGTSSDGMDSARKWVERGAQFFEAIDELSLIAMGAKELVGQYRRLFAKANSL